MGTRESRPGVRPQTAIGKSGETNLSLAVDPDNWRANAADAVLMLAASGRVFDTDQVRATGVGEPPHPNQWGALFSGLRKAGYITPVGIALSGRRQRHAGLNRQWIGAEFVAGDAL